MNRTLEKNSQLEAWLRQHKIGFRQATKFQYKLSCGISYYPGKGTVFVDGEDKARDKTGLDGLRDVLIEFGLLLPGAP